eukprot:gene21524-33118_t
MDGKVCLVTGANTGLGRAIAVDLGKRGAKLILVCRAGHEKAIEELEKELGTEVTYLKVDLSMMKDVARLCDEMKEKKLRVDVAIMNAGLMTRGGKMTDEGLDTMFAVHVMANRLMIKQYNRATCILEEAAPECYPVMKHKISMSNGIWLSKHG